jgi:hypothetical protein
MHAHVHGTRQLRLGEMRRRLAQDLVGLSQLADLALQRLHPLGYLGRHANRHAGVDFGLLDPLVQRRAVQPILDAIDVIATHCEEAFRCRDR